MARLLLALLLAVPGLASAQPVQLATPSPADAPATLEVDWTFDLALTTATGLGWVISEAAKDEIAPEQCRWCARNALDDSVTRRLAWKDIGAASTVGDLSGFVVTPLVTMGTLALASNAEGRFRQEMPANALLMVEAVALSSALNQLVKFSVGRERPFVADLPESEKGRTENPGDNNLSFYSGHSNLAFALAVSAGTVAHLRGYEAEPVIWGVGLPVAAFVAYSRIAAKKHYLTDVLVGSATGAAFGFAVPWLHRGAKDSRSVRVTPFARGAMVAFRF